VPIPPAGAFPVGDPITVPLPAKRAPAIFLGDAIDPETGDYRSILTGVDPVEAAALEALLVRRGSGSAVLGEGNKLHEIEFIDEKLPGLLKSEVEFAWRHLIETRALRLEKIEIESENVGVYVEITMRNLAQEKSRTFQIPLLQLLPRAA
jgi:hypothetical protein